MAPLFPMRLTAHRRLSWSKKAAEMGLGLATYIKRVVDLDAGYDEAEQTVVIPAEVAEEPSQFRHDDGIGETLEKEPVLLDSPSGEHPCSPEPPKPELCKHCLRCIRVNLPRVPSSCTCGGAK